MTRHSDGAEPWLRYPCTRPMVLIASSMRAASCAALTSTPIGPCILPVAIAAALLLGYLTWAVYKLRVHSWWVSFCFSVLTVGWLAGSRSKLDLARYVTGRRISFGLDDKVLSAVFVSLGIAWVIFLVYIKKHFKESPGRNAGVQPMRETR